jgi:TP901 family phage tail tape measure protein
LADIGEIRGRLVLSTDQWSRSINAAQNDLQRTGRAARSISKDVDKLSKVFLGVGGAVALGVGAAVKTGADFEAQMSRVKAISNSTDEEFQAMKKSAMELGASTSKSASEIAVGFENMAAMGMNANDIIAAMPGVISAAEASGSDMAQTADVMASTLNIFSLKATEASRVADILAKESNISAANLTDLQYALKYAGPPAAALGISLEELSGAIGIMANAGIRGEQAGTTLRGGLLRLLNPSEKNTKLMEKMGIAITDAKGNFVGLSKLVDNFSNALKGQTETQKAANLASIVGVESVSGFLSLMKAGPSEIDKMTDSLKNSAGSSAAAAKIMRDNLKGSIDQLKGSLETIGITLSADVLPLLSDFAKEISNVLSSMDEVDMANLKSSLSFAGVASGIGLAGTSLVKLGIAARGLFLAMGGPVTLTIGALAILGASIAAVVVKNHEMEKARLSNIEKGFDEVKSIDESIKAFDRLKSKTRLTNDEFGTYIDNLQTLKTATDPKVIDDLAKANDELQKKSGLSNDELSQMVDLNGKIIEKVPEATAKITDQGNKIIETTNKLKELNNEKLQGLFDDLESQRVEKETEYKNLLEKEKDLIKERQTDETKLQTLVDARKDALSKVRDEEQVLTDMQNGKITATDIELQQQRVKIKQARDDLGLAQNRIDKQKEIINGTDKELESTRKKAQKIEEINQRMAQIILKQAGLNSAKGKELGVIDSAIGKLQKQRAELEKTTTPAQRMTAEYKESRDAIDQQIGKLQTARDKVGEIYGAAKTMNAELAKDISKYINVYVQEQTKHNQYMPEAQLNKQRYHTGGIAGQPPKLHVGGPAWSVAPNHNEIDARLLRNEMVLTEAQQSNLMRMIDAGMTGGSASNGISKSDLDRFTRALEAASNRPVSVEIDGQQIANATYQQIDSKMATSTRMTNRTNGMKR